MMESISSPVLDKQDMEILNPNKKASTPRRVLTLKEKIKVIEASEATGKSQRLLAADFGISKTQVMEILRNKDNIRIVLNENLLNPECKRLRLVKNRIRIHKEVSESGEVPTPQTTFAGLCNMWQKSQHPGLMCPTLESCVNPETNFNPSSNVDGTRSDEKIIALKAGDTNTPKDTSNLHLLSDQLGTNVTGKSVTSAYMDYAPGPFVTETQNVCHEMTSLNAKGCRSSPVLGTLSKVNQDICVNSTSNSALNEEIRPYDEDNIENKLCHAHSAMTNVVDTDQNQVCTENTSENVKPSQEVKKDDTVHNITAKIELCNDDLFDENMMKIGDIKREKGGIRSTENSIESTESDLEAESMEFRNNETFEDESSSLTKPESPKKSTGSPKTTDFKSRSISLEDKIKLIRTCKGKSQKLLSVEFGISQGQVFKILRDRDEIEALYQDKYPEEFELGYQLKMNVQSNMRVQLDEHDILGQKPDAQFNISPNAFDNTLCQQNVISDNGKRQRKALSLEQKMLILQHKGGPKTLRETAEYFGIGKTTVLDIFRRQDQITAAYHDRSLNPQRKKIRSWKCSEINYEMLDTALYEWNKKVVAQPEGVHLSGPKIQKKAVLLSSELGIQGFKASNGWLAGFCKRHRISFSKKRKQNDEMNNEYQKDGDTTQRAFQRLLTNQQPQQWITDRQPGSTEDSSETSKVFGNQDNDGKNPIEIKKEFSDYNDDYNAEDSDDNTITDSYSVDNESESQNTIIKLEPLDNEFESANSHYEQPKTLESMNDEILAAVQEVDDENTDCENKNIIILPY